MILKDKIFFFANYEEYNYLLPAFSYGPSADGVGNGVTTSRVLESELINIQTQMRNLYDYEPSCQRIFFFHLVWKSALWIHKEPNLQSTSTRRKYPISETFVMSGWMPTLMIFWSYWKKFRLPLSYHTPTPVFDM